MSETEIFQLIDPALAVLLEAYTYAQAIDRNTWDFAVEIDCLRDVGVTDGDLRYLICAGYAEHAVELTRVGSHKRVFRRLHNLGLTDKTCFILTEHGESFAHQIGVTFAKVGQPGDRNGASNGEHRALRGPTVPKWDRVRRELRVGGRIVKAYRRPAPNQETILVAFEEEGWPFRIDDPLACHADHDPKRRLHDAINKLNGRQKQRILRFRGDGTGHGILWELQS